MIWSDFLTNVLEELGTDATRRGIESLRTRAIRDAVIDLQRYIRPFRDGHTTTYLAANLTAKGYAHVGTLPEQAKPKAFYVYSIGDTVTTGTTDNPNIVRNRLDFVPWVSRQAMIDDQYGERNYQYSVSPNNRVFMVHPLINDEVKLLLVYDGLKMTFADGDVVPWPEWAAEAVAAYAKYKILQLFDRRPDLAREWYDPDRKSGIYANLRMALYREQREAESASGNDQEYGVTSTAAPTAPS